MTILLCTSATAPPPPLGSSDVLRARGGCASCCRLLTIKTNSANARETTISTFWVSMAAENSTTRSRRPLRSAEDRRKARRGAGRAPADLTPSSPSRTLVTNRHSILWSSPVTSWLITQHKLSKLLLENLISYRHRPLWAVLRVSSWIVLVTRSPRKGDGGTA